MPRHALVTVEDLRRRARARVPRFAFDFVDGGANDEVCARRNAAALQAVELLPRYCVDVGAISTEVELFGRPYAAPLGIAPMGSAGLMWPGADQHLARAAQHARIPYVLATPANAAIETIAALAPDVFWFQLYRFRRNDHAIAKDLVRRTEAAGAHALVLTVDSAGRSKRPRDIRNRLEVPFRVGPRELLQALTSPAWSIAVLRTGVPRTENLAPYVGEAPTSANTAACMRREGGGSHSWEEIARLRALWPRALLVKGILHPADAERAVALGVDGIVVSNHGGRHFDGAPASIDMLPAIAAAVGGRTTVIFDSGVRNGLDVLRALALGARAAFAGRPFLYAVGALGPEGGGYAIEMLREELRTEFQHAGVRSVAEAAAVTARHPGRWTLERPG